MDLAEREALVRRLVGSCGVVFDDRAIDILIRTGASDDDLVAAVGATAARARLHAAPLDAAAARSSLRARQSSAPGVVVPPSPPEPIELLLPTFAPLPRGAPRRLSAGQGSVFALTLPTVPPGITIVRGDDDRALWSVVAGLAGRAALDGATVLWHSTRQRHAAARELATSLLDDLGLGPRPAPSSEVARVAWLLSASPLWVSDDRGTPLSEVVALIDRMQAGVTFVAGWPLYGADVELLARSGRNIVIGTDRVPSSAADVHNVSIWEVTSTPDTVTLATGAEPALEVKLYEAPERDASGALLGWRMWRVDHDGRGPTLRSPVKGVVWPRGVMTATCDRCGSVCMSRCTCGLYAFGRARDALPEWPEGSPLVLGQIRGWGHAVIHERGFRCERAQILQLLSGSLTPEERTALSVAYDCPVN